MPKLERASKLAPQGEALEIARTPMTLAEPYAP